MPTKRVHTPTARKQGEMIQDERGRFVGFKDANVVYIGRRYTQGATIFPEARFATAFLSRNTGVKRL